MLDIFLQLHAVSNVTCLIVWLELLTGWWCGLLFFYKMHACVIFLSRSVRDFWRWYIVCICVFSCVVMNACCVCVCVCVFVFVCVCMCVIVCEIYVC